MKTARRWAMILLSCSLVTTHVGCSSRAGEDHLVETIELPPLCDGSRFSLTIDRDIATTQEQSNALLLHDGTLYVVESGANAVSTFDVDDSTYETNAIDVGNDRNPYDIAISPSGEIAIITNYLAGTFTIADPVSGEILHESPRDMGMLSPSGVAASVDHIYISDVAFGRGADGFGQGQIHVFARGSFEHLGALSTPAKNPQFIEYLPDKGALLISQMGALSFLDGHYRQTTDGAISLLDLSKGDPFRGQWRTAMVPAKPDVIWRDGAPGRPMISSDGLRAYFVSATSPVLLSLDLEQMSWLRGPGDPILLYETDRDALHAGAISDNDLLFVLAYNQDALYLVDGACDRLIAGPIDLGFSPNDLEGPLAIVTDGALRAYFMTSLSKKLGSLTLSPLD